MENKEKRTWMEEWKLIWRAIKIWHEIMPRYWVYNISCTLVEAFSPYFGLYMSAQLVNELAGSCNLHRLLILVAITVCGGFAISLISRLLQGARYMQDEFSWQLQGEYFLNAENDFQYEHLENPDVVLKHEELLTINRTFGGGLRRVLWYVSGILGNVLNILFSASLTISMLTMTAQGEYTGLFGFVNSPASACVIVLLILVNAVGAVKISKTSAEKSMQAAGGLAEVNTRVNAYLTLKGTDMTIFKLFPIVMEEYRKHLLRPKWIEKMQKVRIAGMSAQKMLEQAINIVIFLFLAAKAYIGAFGIGNFILYQGTTSRFIEAVTGLAAGIGNLKDNNRYLVQVYEYLDLPNDMYKGTLAVEKRDDIDYEIEFRDVSFKYPRTDTWALRHVNMKFKIGDKLAIVGENGSGKTTFIKLLCRLYDPTEGKILLNGIDITRYRYEEYMALFSVVFQDYTLFAFPIADNVAALQEYDEERVKDALVRAGFGERLAGLEKGIHTGIGRDYEHDGVDLSGGEMQKVALARALYKDAPFVILDEPTAALDPIAEAEVYDNFNKIVENKTAVFISHRLSSCRFCHNIAVFDKGQLVQQGSHDALVGDVGKYRELWHAQAQYYEGTA